MPCWFLQVDSVTKYHPQALGTCQKLTRKPLSLPSRRLSLLPVHPPSPRYTLHTTARGVFPTYRGDFCHTHTHIHTYLFTTTQGFRRALSLQLGPVLCPPLRWVASSLTIPPSNSVSQLHYKAGSPLKFPVFQLATLLLGLPSRV